MTIAEAESRVLGSTGDQDITGDELASTCQIIVCLELAQIAPADSGNGWQRERVFRNLHAAEFSVVYRTLSIGT